MSDLVQRLATGEHPITSGGPDPSVQRLKEAIDRKYVHIKFTQTKGGTDLGVRLDEEACSFDQADFENSTGKIHVEGTLTLDYVPVRCVADLDLDSLDGTGHLVIVDTPPDEESAETEESAEA